MISEYFDFNNLLFWVFGLCVYVHLSTVCLVNYIFDGSKEMLMPPVTN